MSGNHYGAGYMNGYDYDDGGEKRRVEELFEKFRSFRPYLITRFNRIKKDGRERQLSEEVEDIEYYLSVMSDMCADENHGADSLQGFLDRIHEMIRKNPPSKEDEDLSGGEDEDEDNTPGGPSTEQSYNAFEPPTGSSAPFNVKREGTGFSYFQDLEEKLSKGSVFSGGRSRNKDSDIGGSSDDFSFRRRDSSHSQPMNARPESRSGFEDVGPNFGSIGRGITINHRPSTSSWDDDLSRNHQNSRGFGRGADPSFQSFHNEGYDTNMPRANSHTTTNFHQNQFSRDMGGMYNSGESARNMNHNPTNTNYGIPEYHEQPTRIPNFNNPSTQNDMGFDRRPRPGNPPPPNPQQVPTPDTPRPDPRVNTPRPAPRVNTGTAAPSAPTATRKPTNTISYKEYQLRQKQQRAADLMESSRNSQQPQQSQPPPPMFQQQYASNVPQNQDFSYGHTSYPPQGNAQFHTPQPQNVPYVPPSYFPEDDSYSDIYTGPQESPWTPAHDTLPPMRNHSQSFDNVNQSIPFDPRRTNPAQPPPNFGPSPIPPSHLSSDSSSSNYNGQSRNLEEIAPLDPRRRRLGDERSHPSQTQSSQHRNEPPQISGDDNTLPSTPPNVRSSSKNLESVRERVRSNLIAAAPKPKTKMTKVQELRRNVEASGLYALGKQKSRTQVEVEVSPVSARAPPEPKRPSKSKSKPADPDSTPPTKKARSQSQPNPKDKTKNTRQQKSPNPGKKNNKRKKSTIDSDDSGPEVPPSGHVPKSYRIPKIKKPTVKPPSSVGRPDPGPSDRNQEPSGSKIKKNRRRRSKKDLDVRLIQDTDQLMRSFIRQSLEQKVADGILNDDAEVQRMTDQLKEHVRAMPNKAVPKGPGASDKPRSLMEKFRDHLKTMVSPEADSSMRHLKKPAQKTSVSSKSKKKSISSEPKNLSTESENADKRKRKDLLENMMSKMQAVKRTSAGRPFSDSESNISTNTTNNMASDDESSNLGSIAGTSVASEVMTDDTVDIEHEVTKVSSAKKNRKGPLTRAQAAVKSAVQHFQKDNIRRRTIGRADLIANLGLDKIKIEADYLPPPKQEPVDLNFGGEDEAGFEHLRGPEATSVPDVSDKHPNYVAFPTCLEGELEKDEEADEEAVDMSWMTVLEINTGQPDDNLEEIQEDPLAIPKDITTESVEADKSSAENPEKLDDSIVQIKDEPRDEETDPLVPENKEEETRDSNSLLEVNNPNVEEPVPCDVDGGLVQEVKTEPAEECETIESNGGVDVDVTQSSNVELEFSFENSDKTAETDGDEDNMFMPSIDAIFSLKANDEKPTLDLNHPVETNGTP